MTPPSFFRCLTVAVLFLLSSLAASARVYLVSVGIADYPGDENDLRLPVRDAQTVAWLYAKNAGVQYSLLLDRDATRARIVAAMDTVFARAAEDDIIVFFFSGHGYPGGFHAYDGTLSYTAVRRSMARSRCRHKMIFADACFAGRMRTTGKAASDGSAAESAAKNADVMLFLSSRSNETSIERTGMQNGLFTTYLQKGLRGGADADRDRTVTARELFDYVHRKVVAASRGQQHPVMWGKFADSMPVIVW